MKTRPWLIPTIIAGTAIVGTTAWYIHRRLKNSHNDKPQKLEQKIESPQENKLGKSIIVLKQGEIYIYTGNTAINSISIPVHVEIKVCNGSLTIEENICPSAHFSIKIDPFDFIIEGYVYVSKINSEKIEPEAIFSVKLKNGVDIKASILYHSQGYLTITNSVLDSIIIMKNGDIKINKAILGSNIISGKGRAYTKNSSVTVGYPENGKESVEAESLQTSTLVRR